MSAVSPITIASSSAYQALPQMSNATAQALVALGSALQSGITQGAKAALSTFQQGVANDARNPSIGPFPPNAQTDADYADLVDNVQAGNLSNAQAALTKLELDLQSARTTHRTDGAVPVPTTVIDTSDSAASLETASSSSGNFVNVTV